jgi:hypothetical protein
MRALIALVLILALPCTSAQHIMHAGSAVNLIICLCCTPRCSCAPYAPWPLDCFHPDSKDCRQGKGAGRWSADGLHRDSRSNLCDKQCMNCCMYDCFLLGLHLRVRWHEPLSCPGHSRNGLGLVRSVVSKAYSAGIVSGLAPDCCPKAGSACCLMVRLECRNIARLGPHLHGRGGYPRNVMPHTSTLGCEGAGHGFCMYDLGHWRLYLSQHSRMNDIMYECLSRWLLFLSQQSKISDNMYDCLSRYPGEHPFLPSKRMIMSFNSYTSKVS